MGRERETDQLEKKGSPLKLRVRQPLSLDVFKKMVRNPRTVGALAVAGVSTLLLFPPFETNQVGAEVQPPPSPAPGPVLQNGEKTTLLNLRSTESLIQVENPITFTTQLGEWKWRFDNMRDLEGTVDTYLNNVYQKSFQVDGALYPETSQLPSVGVPILAMGVNTALDQYYLATGVLIIEGPYADGNTFKAAAEIGLGLNNPQTLGHTVYRDGLPDAITGWTIVNVRSGETASGGYFVTYEYQGTVIPSQYGVYIMYLDSQGASLGPFTKLVLPTPTPTSTWTPITFTPTPTSSPTPEPTATFTPIPTLTPQPPTQTPEATATFTPTPEPKATATPTPDKQKNKIFLPSILLSRG